jgi:Tfp pilus assembly protein PilN
MMTWYLLTASGLSQRSKELAQLEEQAEAAALQSADVEELRAERDRLRRQLSALETVRLRRHLALELLRSIALYAPDDIVLSHFRLRPGQAFEIRGTAPSATLAADLQDALAGSPLVTQATLVGIGRTGAQRGQDAERVNFTIRAALWTQRKTPATAWTLARTGGGR